MGVGGLAATSSALGLTGQPRVPSPVRDVGGIHRAVAVPASGVVEARGVLTHRGHLVWHLAPLVVEVGAEDRKSRREAGKFFIRLLWFAVRVTVRLQLVTLNSIGEKNLPA